jgi:hypothetical protein
MSAMLDEYSLGNAIMAKVSAVQLVSRPRSSISVELPSD